VRRPEDPLGAQGPQRRNTERSAAVRQIAYHYVKSVNGFVV
jgi:hypothetical protein